MKRFLPIVLSLIAGCASGPEPAPDTTPDATPEEQQADPLKHGREWIDQRESGDNLDRAVRMLEWHAAKKPDSPQIQTLATEAYSRSIERLQENKANEQAKIQTLLARGKPHADAAIKLAPDSGETQYWRACLLLHEADYHQSLGKANEALALLDKAEVSAPKTDDGGPSRMKGRVLAEMPGLFGGSLKKAVESYKKSLQAAPNSITTHLWLGEAYNEGKKPDLARKEFEWVLAAKPREGHEKEDGADRKKAEDLLKTLKK